MNPWILRAAVALAVVAAFFLGRARSPRSPVPAATETQSVTASTWTCSMHPQVRRPGPGPCPICAMDLVAVAAEVSADLGPTSLRLSPRARQLASIQTTPVVRGDARAIRRLTGKLEADETRRRDVTAWVGGRVDQLYVDFTGVQIQEGDRLFDLYSPDLYADQEALLQALKAYRRSQERQGSQGGDELARKTLAAARERLRLAGLGSQQIGAIEERGAASQRTTIRSPLSGVVLHKAVEVGSWVKKGQHVYAIADLTSLWLQLDAFEDDLPWIRTGQRVAFETSALPGRTFSGEVAFVDPVIDPATRTAHVRVEVPNAEGELKPGMLVRAQLLAESGRAGDALLIPASAPLITGTRAVVYVAETGEDGVFTGREVVLGPRTGDLYVVESGLREGERIVTHGAFRIDSALQIQARPSMMNPRRDATAAEPSPAGVEGPESAQARDRLDAAVELYFALTTALANDESVAASTWAQRLATQLEDAADQAEQPAWQRSARRLAEAALHVAQAEGIALARERYQKLSGELIQAIRTFKTAGTQPVVVYHCPMADQDRGADWLQSGGPTTNPYFGSAMHRCGAASEVLVSGHDDEEPDHGQ